MPGVTPSLPTALQRDVPLAPCTTLEVGGPARFFVRAHDERALADALAWADAEAIPVLLLGGGSNVLVADAGFPGLVLRASLPGRAARRVDGRARVTLGAGEAWDAAVAWTVAAGWGGVECLAGIPGRVGAAPIQNIGAYGQEVGERVHSVRAWDRILRAVVELDAAACGFGYRHSRFKAEPGRYVVLAVTLDLLPGAAGCARYTQLAARLGDAPADLTATRAAVLALRREKSMVIEPADPNRRSAGSFFVNPVVPAATADALAAGIGAPDMPRWAAPGGVKLSAAWLIQRAGMAPGFGEGPVGLSTRHTLAIVNRGAALASEVVAFAGAVRRRVRAEFGVRLDPEPIFVGFDAPADALLDG